MSKFMHFTYCSGYKCGEKEECLRWYEHKKLMKEEINTSKKVYVDSELCIKYNHNNFIPLSVYKPDDK